MYDPQYGYMFYDAKQFKYNKNIAPLFTVNEAFGGYSGSMMWPGGDFSYKNPNSNDHSMPAELPCSYSVKFIDKIPWNKRIDSIMKWFKDPEKPANFVVTYIVEPDVAAHSFTSESEEVKHFSF